MEYEKTCTLKIEVSEEVKNLIDLSMPMGLKEMILMLVDYYNGTDFLDKHVQKEMLNAEKEFNLEKQKKELKNKLDGEYLNEEGINSENNIIVDRQFETMRKKIISTLNTDKTIEQDSLIPLNLNSLSRFLAMYLIVRYPRILAFNDEKVIIIDNENPIQFNRYDIKKVLEKEFGPTLSKYINLYDVIEYFISIKEYAIRLPDFKNYVKYTSSMKNNKNSENEEEINSYNNINRLFKLQKQEMKEYIEGLADEYFLDEY